MQKRNNLSRAKSQVTQNKSSLQKCPLAPPPFNATFNVTKTLRFQSSAAFAVTITIQDIFDLYIVALTAITGSCLVNSFRLKKVKLWGPMASTLIPVSVTTVYPTVIAGISGPTKLFSDTSMGSMEPARLCTSPPQGSAQSMWQSTDATTQFIGLSGPINTVIDLTFDMVLQNTLALDAIFSPGAAVAGASAGKLYVRALDSNGAGLLVPVGYPTI